MIKGDTVRIKPGAKVGQDFTWFSWGQDLNVFIVDSIVMDYGYKLVARGYGHKEDYGNGKIYVAKGDVIPVDPQDLFGPDWIQRQLDSASEQILEMPQWALDILKPGAESKLTEARKRCKILEDELKVCKAKLRDFINMAKSCETIVGSKK